jgi:hypothetical protein
MGTIFLFQINKNIIVHLCTIHLKSFNMKKAILASIVFCAFVISCKSKAGNEKDPNKLMEEVVKNSKGLNEGTGTYNISAPQNWERKDTSMMGLEATFFFEPITDPNATFRTNVNVTTEKIPSQYDVNEYYKAGLQMMNSKMDGFIEEKSGDAAVNGQPAKWLIYKHSMFGPKMEVLVYFIVKNSMAYVITCTCLDNQLPKYEPEFKKIINSFELKQ